MHSGNIGDIVYSLPALRKLALRREEQIALYIKCNVITTYYPGAVHPLKNILINEEYLERLKPLLVCQDYIGSVEKYEGQEIEFNLDLFRRAVPDTTRSHIPRWYFPGLKLTCDLSTPWLKVSPWHGLSGNIIIARSARYQNPRLSYEFLKDYDCGFVGLPEEHQTFCDRFFELPHFQVDNYLELAQIIDTCKLFVGNQSFPFALAEGLKTPRILEVCPFASNVIPHGNRAYDVYCQRDFETYTEEELNENTHARP